MEDLHQILYLNESHKRLKNSNLSKSFICKMPPKI